MEGFNRAECNGCNNRKRLNWNPVNDTHAPSILSRMLELVQQLPMMSHAAQDPTLKTCRIMRDHFREALPLAECHTVDEHVKPVAITVLPHGQITRVGKYQDGKCFEHVTLQKQVFEADGRMGGQTDLRFEHTVVAR